MWESLSVSFSLSLVVSVYGEAVSSTAFSRFGSFRVVLFTSPVQNIWRQALFVTNDRTPFLHSFAPIYGNWPITVLRSFVNWWFFLASLKKTHQLTTTYQHTLHTKRRRFSEDQREDQKQRVKFLSAWPHRVRRVDASRARSVVAPAHFNGGDHTESHKFSDAHAIALLFWQMQKETRTWTRCQCGRAIKKLGFLRTG